MRDGHNLGKRQTEGRGKGNKDKLKGCLRGGVGKGGEEWGRRESKEGDGG